MPNKPDPMESVFAPNAQGTGPKGLNVPGSMDQNEITPPQDSDYNMKQFDLPVPGQSWTAGPGQMPYEQPPQFTNISKAMDYMVERLTHPKIQTNILRMLDAGTPVEALVTPIIMHGASEGKFNMDLAMMMIEPLAVVINGIGHRAGVPVKMSIPRRDEVVDTRPLERMFKKKEEDAKKPVLMKPQTKNPSMGLLSKPEQA